METVAWNSRVLRKEHGMRRDVGDVSMVVDHVDRVIDPYLATVIHKGVIVHSGLYSTLSAARAACEQKAQEFSQ